MTSDVGETLILRHTYSRLTLIIGVVLQPRVSRHIFTNKVFHIYIA
jgi:hypothetical protein